MKQENLNMKYVYIFFNPWWKQASIGFCKLCEQYVIFSLLFTSVNPENDHLKASS